MNTKQKVAQLDAGLRHKFGVEQRKFVEHYCRVFREHAYATPDDSWNEFEKLIAHVLGMKMYYRKALDIIGFEGDVRDFVDEYESLDERMKVLLSDQRKK